MDNSFKVIITANSKVKGIIIDNDTNLEYTNYRLEEAASFASKVKNEYISLLNDIKNKCTISKLFIYEQSSRITNYINDKYKVEPEFLFKDDFNTGVFRENKKKKWFGIIMYIDRSKFSRLSGKVEIINVKINPNNLEELLKVNGIYKAYHMNKKSWITITLDDALDDEIIYSLIDESYKLITK